MAEFNDLTGAPPNEELRMFVTDTLANPWAEQEQLGSIYAPIAESRLRANKIKREEPITVIIGNPPYKEKAKGRGGWVESGGANHQAPLEDWMPPAQWKVSAHAKHLRNLYVYFWRWATWKVFDSDPAASHGIVSFITVAGFLNGPGFEKMRDYLRRTTDEIWVIDCSPEGHQPDVATRVFESVQQPVCIVLASRSPKTDTAIPATVRYATLPEGNRKDKFAALGKLKLTGGDWTECSTESRAPFLPPASGAWATYPTLDDFFEYNGSGVMPGRTWVIAPDEKSLKERWNALRDAPAERKEDLFQPHEGGDRNVTRKFSFGLAGTKARSISVAEDKGDLMPPVRYAFRSFDRQWIIGDYRLINRPNPSLWEGHSDSQVYLTALVRTAPSNGPGLTITGEIPDLDHYKGSFGGRVYPMWRDTATNNSNVVASLRVLLREHFGKVASGEDVVAYIAAVAAHPAYTARFSDDLVNPGLRIPLTAKPALWDKAVALGRRVIWLHTYGERCVDAKAGRPVGAPRVSGATAPVYPKAGAIPSKADGFPNSMDYDAATKRLSIGSGYIENVDPAVWAYEVSGKQVIKQWFSYRRLNRERPLIGDKRPPSPLGDIQPDHWLAEYTTDLVNLLHVLTSLVALEPEQAKLLEAICTQPMISAAEVATAEAAAKAAAPAPPPVKSKKGKGSKKAPDPTQTKLI